MSEKFYDGGKAYRALPFWAWNTVITEDKVREQVRMFADMGMGGFVIHARNGLKTEYMGKQFMDMVKLSVKCAEELGLKVWLYDEDRWPSGNAGGKVTKDKKYRQRSLIVTTDSPKVHTKDTLLAAYRVSLDSDGYLTEYSVSSPEEANVYFYVHVEEDNPRFNGSANVDVLNGEAISKFIESTYEVYYKELGEYFGNVVEAIFTDEPQSMRCIWADRSELSSFSGAQITWTDDFNDTYLAEYGEEIIPYLPEIVFEPKSLSRHRYRYHEHCANRFKRAYGAQIGKWCREHGIAFTGHFIYEETMATQTHCSKDVMRCYEDEQIVGIDILQGKYELATALQCRSVANQMGGVRMMSELYGVNNWDTPFREYFHQGNWQAAMGVNIRVPHLSWVSMLAEGKRDYPATFSYQSPWYLDTVKLEDHFSRIHTVLEGSSPKVSVGVIHPIESYWLLSGPEDKTRRICARRDEQLSSLFEWLSYEGIDFDFVNEALLPSQLTADGAVGAMKYDAILVPDCITLKATTLDALKAMKEKGVRIIFAGGVPTLTDGCEDNGGALLAAQCERIEYTHLAISSALAPYRAFELYGESGELSSRYLFCHREKDGYRWLFLSPARKVTDSEDTKVSRMTLKLYGEVTPKLYNTMNGDITVPEFTYSQGNTVITLPMGLYDTALIRIEDVKTAPVSIPQRSLRSISLPVESKWEFSRAEDNVILLDIAEYSLDGENYMPADEILNADTKCRLELGLPRLTGKFACQPWYYTEEDPRRMFVRFKFNSTAELFCHLAFETADEILLNGEPVSLRADGWYVDKDIRTVALPKLRVGENVIDVKLSIGNTVGAEPMYLLGDFDVSLCGVTSTVMPPRRELAFGSVVGQGMPFYSGSLTYSTTVELPESGDLKISTSFYRCEFVKVFLDGEYRGDVILPPYTVTVPKVSAGEHKLELVAVGNRHNTFGSLHWAIEDPYYGPMHWHKTGDAFSLEYRLKDFGIMKRPALTLEV